MDERTLAILADIGLLTLRIMFAWIFLWPLPGLLKDWQTTVQTTGLLFPFGQRFFTTVSVIGMTLCSIMVMVGIYGRVGAVFLFFFCIGAPSSTTSSRAFLNWRQESSRAMISRRPWARCSIRHWC